MRKILLTVAVLIVAGLGLAGPASAQDTHIGAVTAEPASVPEAGEHEFTVNGSDFLPDTSIIVGMCVSPADTLVPGTSSVEEITAAANEIDALTHCDIANAVPVDVDGDGNWSVTLNADVGDNFFVSAGALDGSQAGATWIPIVPAGALPETGAETGLIAIVGASALAGGALVLREARRLR